METDKKQSATDSTILRDRAEDQLKTVTTEKGYTQNEYDAQRIIHELEVHQIELEMQSAELSLSRGIAETALEKYTDLFDFAQIGFLTLDNNGVISAANLHGAILLGKERSQLIGRCFGVFVSDADRPAFADFLSNIFTSQHKEVCEVELFTEGNQRLNVQISGTAAASGQECRMALIDITERKQTRQALLESEERFRSIVEHSPNMIMIHVDGKFVYLNPAAVINFGIDNQQEYIGKPIIEVVHPDFRDLVLERVAKITKFDQTNLKTEELLIRKDGSSFWAEITGIPTKFEGKSAVQTIAVDITKRVKDMEEILHSKSELDAAQAISHIGSWRVYFGEEGEQWSGSNELYRIHGYSVTIQLSMQFFIDRVHPEEREFAEAAWSNAINGLGPSEWKQRIIVDGRVKWLEVRVQFVNDSSERLIEVFGTVQDVTDQKMTQQALLESEERYRKIFEVESDALVLLDCASFGFIDVNKSALTLYGYSREEFLQLTAMDLSAEKAETEQALSTNIAHVSLRWHRKKDGTVFPVEIASTYFDYKGRTTHVAAIRDISERNRTEEVLCKSNERLTMALAASKMGVWELDLQTNAVLWSPEVHDIVGLKEFDGTFAAFAELLHPDDAEHVTGTLNRAVAVRENYTDEFRIIRPDGEQRWLFNLGRATFDKNGNPLHLIGTVQDITERKQIEEKLRLSEVKFSTAFRISPDSININRLCPK
ncbi:MAG: PAS domain S-box protein [Desulfuromonadales bacterium]|nr:PAS domain S-box protein [Desulfuromonadales bacterium]